MIYHQDIRELGSKNPGFTNFKRAFGGRYAWIVFFLDIFKGAVVSVVAGLLARTYLGDWQLGVAYAGIFALLGHAFPVEYGFKGGKGILVSVAVLMTVEWIPACILLGIFIIVVALTRYVSLGSCIAAVCYPVTILVYSLITGDPCVWINVILSALIAVLILFMHRGNLVRLKNHTEKKLGQKA